MRRGRHWEAPSRRSRPGAYGSRLVAKVDAARKAVARLDDKRAQVSGLSITIPQMATYYTPTIAEPRSDSLRAGASQGFSRWPERCRRRPRRVAVLPHNPMSNYSQ